MAIRVPTLRGVKKEFTGNVIDGIIGGIATGIGSNFGILGTIIAGAVAGAMTKNDAVTVNAVMDGVSALFITGGE